MWLSGIAGVFEEKRICSSLTIEGSADKVELVITYLQVIKLINCTLSGSCSFTVIKRNEIVAK